MLHVPCVLHTSVYYGCTPLFPGGLKLVFGFGVCIVFIYKRQWFVADAITQ